MMQARPLKLVGSVLLLSTAAFATACADGTTDAPAGGGNGNTGGSAAGVGNTPGAGGQAGSNDSGGAGAASGNGGAAVSGNGGSNVSGNGGSNVSGNGGSNVSGNGGAGNSAGFASSANGGFGNEAGNGGAGSPAGNGGMGNVGNNAGAGNAAGQDPGPSVTPGQCVGDLGGYQNGSVTFYTFSMGTTLVNCSYGTHQGNPDRVDFVETGDGQYFAAINTSDYDTAATCGACIEVTRDGNRRVTVTVVDQCPIGTNNKCRAGHLDLSRAAFLQLGSESEGYLGTGNGGMYGQISWRYVPCENEGNVHFRLKEPSNQNWNQLLVENHKYAIEKVEVRVNGTWVNATRHDYNFWEPPNGTFGTPPYRVRVTDINGTVLEDTVDLAPGDQEAANQMTCQ